PTRTGLLDVLERMGARIAVFNRRSANGEPVADLEVRAAPLLATSIAAEEVPRLVDELPLFALAASHARGESVGKGAWELRVKETDRIETVTNSLRALGFRITASGKSRIDRVVPVVARHPAVRAIMRARQRELAEVGDAVIEGRDIGTVVCPGADVKVYLNAERQTRAERRLAERPEIGADALATDLRLRDQSDAERMMPAPDAVRIDTTELDVEDVVGRIEQLVRERQPA